MPARVVKMNGSGNGDGGSGDEIPPHSTENIIAISINTSTVDASTQTLDTQLCATICRCDENGHNPLDVLTNIGNELACHGSDIYDSIKE